MKKYFFIIICAVIGAILVNIVLSTLEIDFNSGIVGGISGAIFGGWANLYLNKTNRF